MAEVPVVEGAFKGGLPYLKAGRGRPLVYLCGFTHHHVNPTGMGRRITLGTVRPFAEAGYEVYFTNRPPGLPATTTFADLAAIHADGIAAHFGEPVDVLGHSTGGSLILQLIADRPEIVRRAVAASAAYRLGPVAKAAQLDLLREIERDGRFHAETLVEGLTPNKLLQRLISLPMRLSGLLIKVPHPSDPIAVLRAEDGFDVYDRLPSIQTETLVICGAKDYFWTPEMFRETAERLPNGTLVMYPKSGHAIVTKKEFFADVLAFLAR